jgi:CRISPR-associated endonuclease/helicase Cas3
MSSSDSLMCIAHRRKDGDCQSLTQHLLEVSSLARRFSAKIGLGLSGELIGLLHDLGKYSRDFQQYLRSAVGLLEQDKDDEFVDPTSKKGKIDHSTAGAQAIWQELSRRGQLDQVAGQMLALCIASHHSGLIDCVAADGTDKFSKRMNKADELSHLDEAWAKADVQIRKRCKELACSTGLIPPVRAIIERISRNEKYESIVRFKVGLLTRFLFSCLVDGDRVNTADFGRPAAAKQRLQGRYDGWGTLAARLERKLATFNGRERIDELRRRVSEHCLVAASREKGIFTLTVPTGGGKTLASLCFALHHAREHEMDRIVYVVPFTTIIDQNAEEVRKVLEPSDEAVPPGSVVLEHHSNLTPDEQTWRNKILSEDWDAPVVFTTSVQLLETLFGAGTRSARRMHNLANAVMIFDEVQALPINCVHLFNNAVNFLVEQCGSTVLLCTATQPLLDRVDEKKGAIRLRVPDTEIVPNVSSLFSDLKRVEVMDRRKPGGWTQDEVAELAVAETKSSGSCLVIVNTKSAARDLFELCRARAPTAHVYHLSAGMCPAHRKERLASVSQYLPNKEPVVCVSTQLIEAGVDVDFGSAVRLTAGLDSIAQAAGRCNRHGLRPPGLVHVLNPREDKAEMLRDIRIGKEVAERVLDELAEASQPDASDLLSPPIMNKYFQYYFFDRSKEMDYPVTAGEGGRDDTLLSMLGENRMAVATRRTPPGIYLRQSFMTAAKAFKAINAPTQGVIVPYSDAGKAVITELASSFDPGRQIDLLKEAQQFSVNVFPEVIARLQRVQAVHEVQEGTGILYVDSRYYHCDFGLTDTPSGPMETLNV